MKCYICGNKDRKLFRESFLPRNLECLVCGVHFIDSKRIYEYKENYFLDKNSDSFISQFTQPLLNKLFELKEKRVEAILGGDRNAKILDYGCGSGMLVQKLNRLGFNAIGFEPSYGARKVAKMENLPVYRRLESINRKFDLIMFWHSLEHIKDPSSVIKGIKKILSSKGKLLIAVPNSESWEAKIAKGKWFHFTYPIHRFYFSPRSLSFLLKRYSFEIDKIDFINFEYTSSSLAQTFLNLFFPKDVLYSIVSRRRRSLNKSKAILISIVSLILTVVISPILIAFYILQLFFKKSGAIVVLTK